MIDDMHVYPRASAPGPRGIRTLSGAVLVLFCAGTLQSGCFLRMQAKAVPEPPPLETPEAPPRQVEVLDVEPPPPILLLPSDLPSNPPPRPRPARPRSDAGRPADTKPETPDDATKPEDLSPPPSSIPVPTLQTTPTEEEGEMEGRIRSLIARATADLNRTNYQSLNADGRTQYETAKRFVTQADDALNAKNLVFANNLADKAAALAAQLSGR
jgi:hypothetical protein